MDSNRQFLEHSHCRGRGLACRLGLHMEKAADGGFLPAEPGWLDLPQASAYQATIHTVQLLSGLGGQDLVLLVLKPSRASLTFSLPAFLFQD